ncbi:MAG: hydrogen peroxide-dependent heme synthase [Bryobacteraceae bacterium]
MQATEVTAAAVPPVPLTLEGASVLHQMMRVKWAAWKALPDAARQELIAEAAAALSAMEQEKSALFSLIGHKGDLLVVHFRSSFEELNHAELQLARLGLSDYLEVTTSYLSVVELGLYESTSKVYASLTAKGIAPHSPEWKAEIESVIARQKEAMYPRLYPDVPPHKYICFYPMDRRRGEVKNWYQVPMADRQAMMHEHGMIGRRYAGEVKQIITGSIGFDDWEWGVDLFADDPLVFKKLIYEMRFDEVSAVYALFGSFFVGVRCPAAGLGALLNG